MLCHKNEEQIARYINCYSENLFDIYIHMDNKSKISPSFYDYILKKRNVFLLNREKTISVERGSFSIIFAELQLLKEAIKKQYFYYIFSSGQDFLVKNSEDLFGMVLKNKDYCLNDLVIYPPREFILRNKIHIFKFCFSRDYLSKFLKKLYFSKINLLCFAFVRKDFKKVAEKCEFKFGSQWIGFNLPNADFALKYLSENKWYIDFFKRSLVPDECFFQTLFNINHAKFLSGIFYIDWSTGKSSPKLLTIKDADKINKSGKFIARKFDSKIDDNIIKYYERKSI